MKTNPNDPINAVLDTNYREGIPTLENRYEGITKREYFAAIAMQGLLAGNWFSTIELFPMSVKMADDLIKQLNQEEQK